jgi:hypothetical protein
MINTDNDLISVLKTAGGKQKVRFFMEDFQMKAYASFLGFRKTP